MGFIGDLFGTNSGNTGGAGMRYQATGPEQYQLNDAWANSQTGLGQQQAFLNALAAQNGVGNQSNVFNQQQALAGQLALQAAGGGPNPAQAQFQQNANQVAAQTAGLIGSQKGMSPALQARLIAQQGAGAGQAAAGQAATLQAQQQLAAQQALMQQQASMANVAGQQVGQQQNAISGYMQGALGQQGNVLGIQGSANAANSGVARQTAGNQFQFLQGIGTAAMGLAHGGQVPEYNYADGGAVGPQSFAGNYFKNFAGTPQEDTPLVGKSSSPFGALKNMGGGGMGQMAGGAGDAAPMASAAPVMAASCGGAIGGEAYAKQMKPVPGKAKVAGDSKKNDTQPAMLSPGEIIIPRSIATRPNAPEMAARFVAAVKAKHGRGIG